MGEVWVADQHEPIRRRVALKVIRPGLDSGRLVARFGQERQALALMNHPNVAKLLDAGVERGRPFFVMELIEGTPLTKYCDEAKLTTRQRLELFLLTCEAVQHAHHKGIIHRDLKPSNVLVESRDGQAIPKVIDFGLAKAPGMQLTGQDVSTEVGTLLGTLEYMSPEQADPNNLDVDTRCDVYALGVLLYELLTGTVPFTRDQLLALPFFEMLRMIREEEPPRPSQRTPALPRELDWIILKCLEKDPARRYETPTGLARDVERYLADEPVLACPPSRGYRLRKFAQRHRRALLAAGAIVLLLVTAVVGLTVALVAVNREREQKVAALEAEGKRRKQTREALDAMFSEVIEDWLGKQPAHLPEHKQFLQLALRYYEEFAADTGQEEESRAGVAQAYLRVGYIRDQLGQLKAAEAAWERSRDLYASLHADFPAVPAYHQGLAETHHYLAWLYRTTERNTLAEAACHQSLAINRQLAARFPEEPGHQLRLGKTLRILGIVCRLTDRAREAEERYGQAIATLKPLADKFPDTPDYHDDLAYAYLDLGQLLDVNPGRKAEALRQDPGRAAEVVQAFRQAVAIYERLATNWPGEPHYRDQLANCRDNLGNSLRNAEQYPEAEKLFRQALAIYKQLANEFPSRPRYQRARARTLNNLGILLRRTGRAQDAEAAYGEGLDIHKKLAKEAPESPEIQNYVAGAMVNLGRMLLDRKEYAGACRLFEDALPYHDAALKANSHHPDYRNFYRINRWRMAEALLGLKDHAAAAVTARQFLEMKVEPARDAYTAACLLADCVRVATKDDGLAEGQRQQAIATYGASAVAALRLAVEKGAKEVTQLPTDARLAPLRQREDFQKLLAELQARR